MIFIVALLLTLFCPPWRTKSIIFLDLLSTQFKKDSFHPDILWPGTDWTLPWLIFLLLHSWLVLQLLYVLREWIRRGIRMNDRHGMYYVAAMERFEHTHKLQRVKTFTIFPRLPQELQIFIFEIAAADYQPQVIAFETSPCYSGLDVNLYFFYYSKATYLRGLRYHPPSILHVSQMSRKVAMKFYTPAFEKQLGHSIYFNFQKDALCFTDSMALEKFANHGLPKGWRPRNGYGDLDQVLFVWVLCTNINDYRGFYGLCEYFLRAKEVYLMYQNPLNGMFAEPLVIEEFELIPQSGVMGSHLVGPWLDNQVIDRRNWAYPHNRIDWTFPRAMRGTVNQWHDRFKDEKQN